jgi:hypothetical protein
MCEKVKITRSQVWTVGRMEKKSQPKSASSTCVLGLYFLVNPCIMCTFSLVGTSDTECTLLFK